MEGSLLITAIALVLSFFIFAPLWDKVWNVLFNVDLFPNLRNFLKNLLKPEPYDGCTPPKKDKK